MILLGYISILFVVAFLVILSEKVLVKFLDKEYCRKILHICTFFVFPLAEIFLGKGSIHFIIICAIFSVFTLLLYFFNIFKTVDSREKKYPGIFYYSFSLLVLSIICYFNKSLTSYFGIAFIGLALGDGFATLLGYKFKGPKIYKEKTYIGFISCFVFTLIGLAIYSALNGSFLSILQITLISLLVSIVELVDFGLDNIVIPLATFGMSYFIVYSQNALIALAVFEAVFIIVFLFKIIEYYGALAAATIGFLFYYFGGTFALAFVVCCYFIMLVVSLIGKVLKNDVSSVVKKTKSKDFIEIFVNGVWPVVSILLFALTENHIFFVISLITMSEGFVDSLASDIGTLSKKEPYDLIRRKIVPKGLSGGVTFLGSMSSFIGSICFAVAIKYICELNYYSILLIAIIIYSGSIVDSILGSTIQVKFHCNVCGSITEKEVHCEKETSVISGCKWINNDVVNCLSGFFVFLLSMILFFVL